MDRRFKDYYIVTFKRHIDHYSYGSGYQTTAFCKFPSCIKVHWRSIRNIPYAIVSVDKDMSEPVREMFESTYGVDRVIPFTESKERDWLIWHKILRFPTNDYWQKVRIEKCMAADLFIDWIF